MFDFNVRIKAGKNFRPSWLICEYAKTRSLKTLDCYGSTCLVMNGMVYGYDHYIIQKNNDGTETVIVTMIIKER